MAQTVEIKFGTFSIANHSAAFISQSEYPGGDFAGFIVWTDCQYDFVEFMRYWIISYNYFCVE